MGRERFCDADALVVTSCLHATIGVCLYRNTNVSLNGCCSNDEEKQPKKKEAIDAGKFCSERSMKKVAAVLIRSILCLLFIRQQRNRQSPLGAGATAVEMVKKKKKETVVG